MQDFSVCPACGYSKGFHVSFQSEPSGNRIILICPSCAARYDVGWLVTGLADVAQAL